MIAIGTDIVTVARIEQIWRRHGERFVERILTGPERERCAQMAEPWRFLARRFAAKEAVAKALGCGIGVRLSWQDMRIENNGDGAPLVHLTARAQALAEGLGGARVLLSISDEREYALAFAALVE